MVWWAGWSKLHTQDTKKQERQRSRAYQSCNSGYWSSWIVLPDWPADSKEHQRLRGLCVQGWYQDAQQYCTWDFLPSAPSKRLRGRRNVRLVVSFRLARRPDKRLLMAEAMFNCLEMRLEMLEVPTSVSVQLTLIIDWYLKVGKVMIRLFSWFEACASKQLTSSDVLAVVLLRWSL
jgi:hypothetical protein